ncbi:hypothetical protein J7U46_15295 [Pelomonas sp. V22]|uniref:hypothetical protein n=1 Tax=Pelomonas sp. V22 TaxID=2822139 RepID=UPI0024A98121|nr:hypothetical protein [Pelomonas sp. V22]MDI4634423.1 hypothetical protein [Pelomonas sp. V22]
MSRTSLIFTLCTAALCLASESAWADSSVVSSASNSASSTSGSVSDSIERSSHSSSGGDKKVAAGNYKVIEVAEAAQRPGHVRLRLQALAPEGGEFVLILPRQAADKGGVIATGAQITAAERPYGLEFSNTTTTQAFFLVLEDAWHKELKARPV